MAALEKKKTIRKLTRIYLADPMLFPRLEKLVEDTNHKFQNINDVVEYLKAQYPDYANKKHIPFRNAVEQAYGTLKDTLGLATDSDDDEDSDEDMDEDQTELSADQGVNSSLRNLYKLKDTEIEIANATAPIDDNDSADSSDCEILLEIEGTNPPPAKPASVTAPPTRNIISKAPPGNAKGVSKDSTDALLAKLGSDIKIGSTSIELNGTGGLKRALPFVLKPDQTPGYYHPPATKKRKEIAPVNSSTVTFQDIGLPESTLKTICKLVSHLKHPEVYDHIGVKAPKGVLLHGPPGCGKTLLAHAIAGELQVPFIKISATEIIAGVSGESEEKIRTLFDQACDQSPCILFVDSIDVICPKRETSQREMERRIVTQLMACMDDLSSSQYNVVVMGATSRPDALDPALRMAGRFDREVSLGIPDEKAREKILSILCKGLKLAPEFDFSYLAHYTPGYVGADLVALTTEAAMAAIERVLKLPQESEPTSTSSKASDEEKKEEKEPVATEERNELQDLLRWLKSNSSLTPEQLKELHMEMKDFKNALQVIQPSAKREGFATVPEQTWDDVGALYDIRKELQMAIVFPVHHQKKYASLGLSRPSGIMLCGPPGCGKTLLAKAVANEAGINFIAVKGPELFNMYVGESERAVRLCFQRARNSAPCVIFFDELDALCPKRNDSDSGSGTRVVNQLLTEMDGLESRKGVFLMAATNRPDIIDPAIMRPGRFDKVLYLGFPLPSDRVDILKAITKNGTCPPLHTDVDLEQIGKSDQCTHFTGADLGHLVREAALGALQEVLSSTEEVSEAVKVAKKHFDWAFKRIQPSVSEKDRKKYDTMKSSMSLTQNVENE